MSALVRTALDHVVIVTSSLSGIADRVERATGIRPAPGGRHRGNGSANLLVALEGRDRSYVEFLGPDPLDPEPPSATETFFGIDLRDEPVEGRVLTWAVRSADLDGAVAEAGRAGVDLGTVSELSRQQPDGTLLTWRLTRAPSLADPLPFLIDWADAPHPSQGPPRLRLEAFSAQTSDIVRSRALAAGIELPVADGGSRPLRVVLSGPAGSLAF